ncbi:MAM domain-containing protein 2 [Liparis tanakae]|uniref:MAM domain-containing protein 2 n=1 Tax=Liparis tanakae TaxID=230148 RepID=A0A4Z2FJW0_9TELE|nr:MAM domain-containing protein 2 [Liparis tanakae]
MSSVRLALHGLLLCGFLGAQQLLPGSCNFELGTCGYTSDAEHGSWSVNEEGHLITVDAAGPDAQQRAVLVSPLLDLQDWSCVRLVYQVTGGGSLQLHLRPHGDNFDHRLWTASTASDSWLIASVDLPNATSPNRILLEGRPERGSGNSVAIFEIHIVPGYCIECNFEEHHLCGYRNNWNPNVNWYVGGSVAREANLLSNHTNNNQRGQYMYVDSVYVKQFQEVAKLTSPMTTAPVSGCLSFYYNRDQERGNIFLVFTKDQLGHYEEIWRPEVYATAGWTQVSLDIKAPHPLEVEFEVAFNSARGGYVAIDDISFSPEFCHTDTEPTVDPAIANCDFEDGLCLYRQDRAESTAWSRVVRGYVGRLHGPLLPGSHRYCLRFYYLLHGYRRADSALLLYVYDQHNVAQEKLWSLSHATRAAWTQVELSYSKPMLSKVVFVSICKNFWECGLAAIDDITVSLGDCRMTAGSLPGRCDFEGGVCGFIQDEREDKADWLRGRGHTPTSYTGPQGDHTTGVGYFMYIEASLMRPGHKARLLTSDLRGSSSPQCLVFYLHMYGSGTGILSVLLRGGGGGPDALLWRRRGEQGVGWMRAMVDYHCDARHQIVFEAIRGPTLRSDIAIDDIHFKRGPCEGGYAPCEGGYAPCDGL